jgi:hypothetical protein
LRQWIVGLEGNYEFAIGGKEVFIEMAKKGPKQVILPGVGSAWVQHPHAFILAQSI